MCVGGSPCNLQVKKGDSCNSGVVQCINNVAECSPTGPKIAQFQPCNEDGSLACYNGICTCGGTAGFEYPAHAVRRRAYDVRKLLDAARDPADLRPLRLAFAESWVAERFVPPARWKKWAASESVDGELAWATEATEAAVAAWESTA
jgi:hypothetical protein